MPVADRGGDRAELEALGRSLVAAGALDQEHDAGELGRGGAGVADRGGTQEFGAELVRVPIE